MGGMIAPAVSADECRRLAASRVIELGASCEPTAHPRTADSGLGSEGSPLRIGQVGEVRPVEESATKKTLCLSSPRVSNRHAPSLDGGEVRLRPCCVELQFGCV